MWRNDARVGDLTQEAPPGSSPSPPGSGGRCQAGPARVFPTRRLFLMDCCRVTAAPTSVFMALAVFGRYREERFVAWQQRRGLAELAWFCGFSALLIGLH